MQRQRARPIDYPSEPWLGLELDVQPGIAVFVANDQMSIGLFSALRERGIRVPEDVSVVGFDDVPEPAGDVHGRETAFAARPA